MADLHETDAGMVTPTACMFGAGDGNPIPAFHAAMLRDGY